MNKSKPNVNAGACKDFAEPRQASRLSAICNWQSARPVLLQILVVGLLAYLSLSGVRAAYEWLSPSSNILHDALVWFGFLALSGLSLFVGGMLMLIFVYLVNYKTFNRFIK